jgi:thioesterase-3
MQMKTYRCSLQVRGYELDGFGHVNHANYLNYLEHARWDALAQEGITLPLLEKLQRWPVIAKLEIKYVKPAFMGETLDITTRCVEHSDAGMVFEQKIERAGILIAEARIHGVSVNEKGRPARHPEEMERLWK